MTRFPGLDPEVLADLREREASEGDRGRSRETALAFGDPTPVEHWPCRGCGVLVGIPQAALDAHAAMDRLARRRDGRPLAKTIPCDECKRKDDELEQARRRPHEQRKIPLGNKQPTPPSARDFTDHMED